MVPQTKCKLGMASCIRKNTEYYPSIKFMADIKSPIPSALSAPSEWGSQNVRSGAEKCQPQAKDVAGGGFVWISTAFLQSGSAFI